MRLVSIQEDREWNRRKREGDRKWGCVYRSLSAHHLPNTAASNTSYFRTKHLVHHSPSLVILSLTPSWLAAARSKAASRKTMTQMILMKMMIVVIMMTMMTCCWCLHLLLIASKNQADLSFIMFAEGPPLGNRSLPNSSVRLDMQVEALSQQCVHVWVCARVCLCVSSAWLRASLCILSPSSSNTVRREETVTGDLGSDICSMCHSTHIQTRRRARAHMQLIVLTFTLIARQLHTRKHAHSAECKSYEINHTHTLPTETQGGYGGALGCLKTPKHMSTPPSIPHWGSEF